MSPRPLRAREHPCLCHAGPTPSATSSNVRRERFHREPRVARETRGLDGESTCARACKLGFDTRDHQSTLAIGHSAAATSDAQRRALLQPVERSESSRRPARKNIGQSSTLSFQQLIPCRRIGRQGKRHTRARGSPERGRLLFWRGQICLLAATDGVLVLARARATFAVAAAAQHCTPPCFARNPLV